MPGRWTFHYSLIPHAGGWESAFTEAHRFARSLRAVRTDGGSAEIPAEASLLELEPPELVLSALKIAEVGDGVVARVYNTSDEPVVGRLRFSSPSRNAQMVDLNEEPAGPAEVEGSWVSIVARPSQILTVKLGRPQTTPK